MGHNVGQQEWIETWAKRIEARGLSPVALLLIQATHPFGPLGSQALFALDPLLRGIVSQGTVEHATALLDNPQLLDQLRICLEREVTG